VSTAVQQAPSTDTEQPHVDVLIVGAGLSGIGAAVHLQTGAPGTTYAIVEARATSGGTWDLFRYPGVRSDSDMFTLGYAFRPWPGAESIAGGTDILDYLRATAAEYGIDGQISYSTKVVGADWSDAQARWTVTTEDVGTGERTSRTCAWLYLCSGYYRYDEGYTPTWPGQDGYTGTVVHPQHWPADLDVVGKRVVVIGSGATAVTLVPALAETAAHVTMLQRSPSYVLPMPAADPLADLLRRRLSPERAYRAIRWKNVQSSQLIYGFSQRFPKRMRAVLRRAATKALPVGYDLDTHFTPTYDPWDQRMCLSPGGDLFAAIRSGTAEVVTDHIESFTPAGLRLRSGAELEADVVVTATGLNLLPLGGIPLSLSGEPVQVAERVAYRGMMLEGVPNLAFAIGYTNASWTLKVDLVSAYVARVVREMRERGVAMVTPRLPGEGMQTTPMIDMTSGYFERSRDLLPLQGAAAPWRLRQRYTSDAPLFRGGIDDPELELQAARSSAETMSPA